MATIQITDSEALGNLSALLDRVRQGEEIVFTEGPREIATLRPGNPRPRTLDECIALLPADSPVLDEDFAKDVEAASAWHREPLDTTRWD